MYKYIDADPKDVPISVRMGRLENVNVCVFNLCGLRIAIKVASHNVPSHYHDFLLAPSGKLLALEEKYHGSDYQRENCRMALNQKHKVFGSDRCDNSR